MPSLAEKIDSYFIQMEWPFERVDEHLWRTAHQGDIQVSQIFVSTNEEHWISFRTRVSGAPAPACAAATHEHLMRLNSLIPLTKFCTMENGDVFAMIDLPTPDLDYSEFRTALLNLVNHVDAYDAEIVAICQDPDRSSTLKKGAAAR